MAGYLIKLGSQVTGSFLNTTITKKIRQMKNGVPHFSEHQIH